MPALILASASPARRNLLLAVGLELRVVPADVDERALQASWAELGPGEVARRLALCKGREVAAREPGVVIAADQVLWDGEEVVGKPTSPEDHLRRLLRLRGRWHELHTAWAVLDPTRVDHGLAITRLRVRGDLEEGELRRYVLHGEGAHCAGGYAVEGWGGWLFESIEGDWTNVLGLPLFPVLGALRARGWRVPGGAA